jgi:hypothetical protein
LEALFHISGEVRTMESVVAYLCKLSKASQPIRQPILKFGGQPVFLDETDWPTCKNCGNEMEFLAQISLQAPLRFSERYRMAYIFMCPGQFDGKRWLPCETWSAYGGANAVILQATSDRVIVPDHVPEYPDHIVDLEMVTEPQVDTTDYRLEESLLEAVSASTKIGGVPYWIQNDETPACPVCEGAMKFVAQLDEELVLPTTPEEWDGYKGFNFGDAGIGYLFLCENECGPRGAAFLWQCA